MKMTNFARRSIGLALFGLGSIACAAPFLAIGDGAELFVTGAVSVRADDNIFLQTTGTSDVIFDITPGAELTFGKDAQVTGAFTLAGAFSNYADNSNLNTSLFSASFNAGFDDGKLKLNFNAGFRESNQNTVDNRGLTRRDSFTIGGTGEVEISQITSVGAGITAAHTNYKRAGYADSDDLTVPINFYYKWTQKIDLSAGYQYRGFQTQIGKDSTDHFFNVGARGEFTPKLSGGFNVGISTRELDGGGGDSMLGLSASFNYAVTPKTGFQLTAGSSADTSPQGAQQKNYSVGGTISSAITDQWRLRAGLSYRGIDYSTRVDDFIEAQVGATFVVNHIVSLVGAYVFRNNGSELAGSEFSNHVFSISASLRY